MWLLLVKRKNGACANFLEKLNKRKNGKKSFSRENVDKKNFSKDEDGAASRPIFESCFNFLFLPPGT